MSNYIQLKKQIEKLQKEAETLRKRERAETIANIKEAIAAYELSAEDLGLPKASRSRRRRKAEKKAARKPAVTDKRSVVAVKYRDAATSATWTGRGKQPKWLATALKSGRKLEEFKI